MKPGDCCAWSELEHSLVTSWSLDTLAVQADLLQQQGDSRGELIALDLLPSPEDRGWRHRRQALLVDWLGEALAAQAGHLVQHGFIHALRDDRFHPPGLLDSPLGTFVRSYTARGDEQVLARLASHPRPWLTQLTFIPSDASVRVSDAVRDALIAATPHLQELQLLGARPPFDAFPHPAVQRVYLGQETLPGQRNSLAVPDGVGVLDCPSSNGRRGPWVAEDALELALDAVSSQPDCGRLHEDFGEYFIEGDSLPALLTRLRSAGLVTLEGPIARLTTAGRVLRDQEPLRAPQLPKPTSRYGSWVLWAGPRQPVGERHPVPVNSLSLLIQFLENCLARIPLDKNVQDVLVGFRRFLDTLVAEGEGKVLAFDAPGPLTEAVETLLELWDLDYRGHAIVLSNEGLRVLESALRSRHADFHLVWGW